MRLHKPAAGSREDGHALTVDISEDDEIVYLPVKRGDGKLNYQQAKLNKTSATIHDERIVHGSPGNTSDIPRKTYVIAFRTKQTVEHERKIGFNHSHNNEQNWDTFISETALQ